MRWLPLMLAACTSPEPVALVLPLASQHFGEIDAGEDDLGVPFDPPELNEHNLGIGAQWTAGELRVEAGAFVNSYDRWAPYCALEWPALSMDRAELGLGLGLSDYGPQGLLPMGGPYLAVRFVGRTWLRAHLAPRTSDFDGALLLSAVVR